MKRIIFSLGMVFMLIAGVGAMLSSPDVQKMFKGVTSSFANLPGFVAGKTAKTDLAGAIGDAPLGWTKSVYVSESEKRRQAAKASGGTSSEFGLDPATVAQMEFAQKKLAKIKKAYGKEVKYIFEKGPTHVIVNATYAAPQSTFGSAEDYDTANDNRYYHFATKDRTEFASVGGLRFFERNNPRKDRILEAKNGAQIMLRISSNANDDDLLQILAILDTDAMNQMKSKPRPEIGGNEVVLLAASKPVVVRANTVQPTVRTAKVEPEKPKKPVKLVCRMEKTVKRCKVPTND